MPDLTALQEAVDRVDDDRSVAGIVSHGTWRELFDAACAVLRDAYGEES